MPARIKLKSKNLKKDYLISEGQFHISFPVLCPEIPGSFSELSVVQKEDKMAAHIITSVRYSTDQT